MHERSSQREARLEAYLDGRLKGAEREAFEEALARDEALAAEVSAQQALEQSLKRLYAPTASGAAAAEELLAAASAEVAVGKAAAAGGSAGGEAPAAGGVVRRIATAELQPWQAVAVTAAVILLGLGGWQVWQAMDPLGGSGYASHGSFSGESPYSFYMQEVEAGFEPHWTCPVNPAWEVTPDRLAGAMFGRSQSLLAYTPPDPGDAAGPEIEVLGGMKVEVFSRGTIAIFARVAGEPVMVFIDAEHRSKRPMREHAMDVEAAGLHAHHRTIGTTALYEISPHPEAHVLGLFSQGPAAHSDDE